MEQQVSLTSEPVRRSSKSSQDRQEPSKSELPMRVREFFDQRERRAWALVGFFRAMEEAPVETTPRRWTDVGDLSPGDEALYSQFLADHVRDLPSEVQKACMLAWDQWSSRTRSLHRQLAVLAEGLGVDDWRRWSPEDLGAKLFKSSMGHSPEGMVRAVIRGPILLLVFEHASEWRLFTLRSVPFSKETDPVTPYYTNDAKVFADGDRIPLVAFHAPQVDPSLVRHETQHLLNHCLASRQKKSPLLGWEQKNDGSSPELAAARRLLKDEVLAYLRDGRSPSQMYASLLLPVYKHLFPDKYSLYLEKVLEKIVFVLADHPLIHLESPSAHAHARELLVASLLDVPLHKMVSYLRLSAKYYHERLNGKYGNTDLGLLDDHIREMSTRESYLS